MAKKKSKKKNLPKKLPPSRKPWEAKNPTVSTRVPLDVKNKLNAVLKVLNMTKKDFFMAMVGEFEIEAQQIAEAEQGSYDAGFKDGYTTGREKGNDVGYKEGNTKGHEEGKQRYGVFYKCRKCGRPKVITSQKEKEIADKLMTEAGDGHEDCPNPKPPEDPQK